VLFRSLLASAIEQAVAETLGELAPEPPPMGPLDVLLAKWVRRIDAVQSAHDSTRRTRLLIVFDQFEEYFLYHDDQDGEGTLAVELPRAITHEGLRANFAISIREDAYAQLDRFKGRVPNLFDSYVRIRHLDRDAAKRAIILPVEAFNRLLPPGDTPFSVQDELVTSVLDEVKAGSVVLGPAGAGSVGETTETRVETPFLQLVMWRLWQQTIAAGDHELTLARLKELGGAERIVHAHLNAAMQELDPAQQELAARVFHQLVTPSGTKIQHTLGDLSNYADLTPGELLPILETLAAKRILRPVDPPPGETEPRFEIFHDVLAAPILEWRAANVREVQERQKRRHERRKISLLASAAIVLALGVVAVVGLALSARQARNDARREARHARQQERLVKVGVSRDYAKRAFARLPTAPRQSLQMALRAFDIARTPQAEAAIRAALAQPQLVAHLPSKRDLLAATMSPDGTIVATESAGATSIWRTATRTHIADVTGPKAMVQVENQTIPRPPAFSPNGRLLATLSDNGTVRVWRPTSGARVAVLHGHRGAVMSVAFSRNGRLLVTAGVDGTAQLWRVGTWRRISVLRGHHGPVRTAAFSPNGSLVVTAGDDGTARIWKATGGTAITEIGRAHV